MYQRAAWSSDEGLLRSYLQSQNDSYSKRSLYQTATAYSTRLPTPAVCGLLRNKSGDQDVRSGGRCGVNAHSLARDLISISDVAG